MHVVQQFFATSAWQTVFLGNTLYGYLGALVIFLAGLVVLWVLQYVLIRHVRTLATRTATDIDDLLVALVDSVRPAFFVVLALFIALRFLVLSPFADRIVIIALLIFVVYQAIRSVGVIIEYLVRKRFENDQSAANAARFLTMLAKGVLWALGGLLILQNAGVNVTSLIAGLGIGGIAVAFALQSILEDLFSSFSIFFDKPFEVGDAVTVEGQTGTVEKIGIKTTRIRSLQGEQIVLSNKTMTNAIIQNFKRLNERRVTFGFGIVYEIDIALLKQIPKMVQDIVESTDGARFARAHFRNFGDSSLDFEVTYYVESDEYDTALDIQQAINFAILEKFAQEKIDMAYPVVNIHLADVSSAHKLKK